MNRDFPVDFMPEKQTVTFRFVLFLFAFWSFVGVAKGQCTEPQGAFVNEVYCSGQVLNYDLQANIDNHGNGIASTFNWKAVSDNPDIAGETLNFQSSSMINDELVNLTGEVQYMVYQARPTAISDGCVGDFFLVIITLEPAPAGGYENATTCAHLLSLIHI